MPDKRNQSSRIRTRLPARLWSPALDATMPNLPEREWRLKYTPDDDDLVGKFYVPALQCAVRYDRSTGYFSAKALTLAMRGIEGLVRNGGHMRLIVGCTLAQEEVDAIEHGMSLRDAVTSHLTATSLETPDQYTYNALELLAWMIENHKLDVKLAVPCDRHRRPIHSTGIFHEKSGVIEDAADNRLAFTGSLNETYQGWHTNWEAFSVFTSWSGTAEHAALEAANFARLWADKAQHVITLDVPSAIKQNLLQFLPESDQRPTRLQDAESDLSIVDVAAPLTPVETDADVPVDVRNAVWSYIKNAAQMQSGGERVGEATCAVNPWPHQIHAFERLYRADSPRLLIADEVGLGKTIQAGLLLRQMWLSGRAKRILVLTPAAVMKQWQVELREKFNLNWPVYDDGCLTWLRPPSSQAAAEQKISRSDWHKQPFVIASSHLMRRKDRETELIDDAEPWDLIVLDEAHHARRKGAGSAAESGPNSLLRLLHKLRTRTNGLVMLTATPMQVHPIEVWDLLDVLGLPPEWNANAFLNFFELAGKASPSADEFEVLAAMFRASERSFGETSPDALSRAGLTANLRSRRILEALRDNAVTRRRMLEGSDRKAAIALMKATTPVSRLISRHTRGLLRKYFQAGKISTPIAKRDVRDVFVTLSSAERAVYEAVEDYISTTYNQASQKTKNAVGFVMTVYRRRLASSFRALKQTLQNRRDAQKAVNALQPDAMAAIDDASDDENEDEMMDADDVARMKRETLHLEEMSDIQALLARVEVLGPDTKAQRLKDELTQLKSDGYTQAMVFTQFTDTMDFLRKYLSAHDNRSILCFSGRGGEQRTPDGTWKSISRDDVKKLFKEQRAEILLCTDAAAEGLNFQFCGALVNYDMPWNPMRVEQRIGRIDRLGQQFPVVRILNLHYENTVEADVYLALRNRIKLFESVVGRLQPILSQLPRAISDSALRGSISAEARAQIAANVTSRIDAIESDPGGLDLDLVTEDDLSTQSRAPAALDLEMLDAVVNRADLLPLAVEASMMRVREYRYLAPGMTAAQRVTTDAAYFEEHSESVELWSPGSPLFPDPAIVEVTALEEAAIRAILNPK